MQILKVAVVPIALCVLIASAVSSSDEFLGEVTDTGGNRISNVEVDITEGGTYITGDRGQFTFPLSDRVNKGSEVTFHVSHWVVLKPCELANGRTYLPETTTQTIRIKVIQLSDPKFNQFAYDDLLLACLVQEAVSRFEIPLNHTKRPEAQLLEKKPNDGFAARFPEIVPMLHYVSYSFTISSGPQPAYEPQTSVPRNQDEFLKNKANEFGIAEDDLRSELNSWLAAHHDGYDLGLVELYTGQYLDAVNSIEGSISPSDDSSSETVIRTFVPLARAEYEVGDMAGAKANLQKYLDLYHDDSVAKKDLAIVSPPPPPVPAPPFGITIQGVK